MSNGEVYDQIVGAAAVSSKMTQTFAMLTSIMANRGQKDQKDSENPNETKGGNNDEVREEALESQKEKEAKNAKEIEEIKRNVMENRTEETLWFLANECFDRKVHAEALEALLAVSTSFFKSNIQAMEQIVKMNRNWDEQKAQKKMQEIFKELTPSDKLVKEYRKRLQNVLI